MSKGRPLIELEVTPQGETFVNDSGRTRVEASPLGPPRLVITSTGLSDEEMMLALRKEKPLPANAYTSSYSVRQIRGVTVFAVQYYRVNESDLPRTPQ